MSERVLVFYGSYRTGRMGIRLADYCVHTLQARGVDAELVDAKAVNLPMLDRMYKEYPPGEAPEAMEALAGSIRGADGFVFVTGEYNWGMQPGLKNLTDHFLEEWFWRPAKTGVRVDFLNQKPGSESKTGVRVGFLSLSLRVPLTDGAARCARAGRIARVAPRSSS